MRTNSIAFRLFATAVAWTLIVLPVAGWIIYSLYRAEVESRFDRYINALLTVVLSDSIDHGEQTQEPGFPKDVGEPLYEDDNSGSYWQIKPLDDKTVVPLMSKSLAGALFQVPSEHNVEPNEKEVRWADLEGPGAQTLRVAETIYLFGTGKKAQRYSVAVAGTLGEVRTSLLTFRTSLTMALALAGIGLLAVTLMQIRFGLLPLQKVEHGLAAIRSGDDTRLSGELPEEIRPLQQEINALLKSNQEIVERARTHVGNLAHALKTPLAVILNEARGDAASPLSLKVTEQAGIMSDQITLYLERARMAARIGAIGRVSEIRPVGESIIRTLERIYDHKHLDFSLECPEGARFQGERQDLEEMLGNLLDNASKWARSKVQLTATPVSGANGGGNWLQICVDDDGPGLSDEQLKGPIVRGRRLDETQPGTGLGHSIVADLAYAYSGHLELTRSEFGGLSARLTLPSAT
jgi:signal transduction histidine kinase